MPGYEANNWWGILAPAGVTPAMVRTLEAAVAKVVKTPDMQKKFDSQGAEVLYMNSVTYGKFIKAMTELSFESMRYETIVTDPNFS